MTSLVRHIEGTDAHGYADTGEGVILLTIDTATAHDYRTVVDTEMNRESAASLIVQLLDAYGVDDAVKAELAVNCDAYLFAAIEEVGWT